MRTNTVYVRVRDSDRLNSTVAEAGKQAALAMRSGIAAARVSQLLRGKIQSIPIEDAAALEDALKVERGTLFLHPRPDLAPDYCRAA